MVFITSYISGQRKTFAVYPKNDQFKQSDSFVSVHDVIDTLYRKEGTCDGIFLTCEGKPVYPNDVFSGDSNVIATLQLRGGKGGFGSMLRAIGAQIEKTTNREACRDLSGRRLRDINEEKRLKDFLAKKVEDEREKLENKRKKLQQLKDGPKHMFEDKTYFEQREKREKDIHDSLDKAFSSGKDSQDQIFKSSSAETSKKVKGRMLDDLDNSSESEDSSDDDESLKVSVNEDRSSSADADVASSSSSSASTSSTPSLENVDNNGEKRELESDNESEHADKKLKTN